jgi:MFS family permease
METRRRLFIASCLPLVANGMAFAIATDIMGDYERFLRLSKTEVALALGAGSILGVAVQFFGGAILDFLRIGRALWVAFAFHILGITTVVFALDGWWLATGWTFMAVASNMVEASINPLVASMYPEKKTHMLNVLHAWWPGGIIIGGLLAFGLTIVLNFVKASSPWLADHSWQIKMATVFVPVLAYAVLIFGQQFPMTERAQRGVSTRAMYMEIFRPGFLLLMLCMFLTASIELGPNRWVGVFIKDITGLEGVLFLVYTSVLMFVLRHFAGPLAKRISSFGILIASSVLSGLGLLWMGYASGNWVMLAASTVFGVGVTFFWPTMLGVTSEKFPRGGAFLMGTMGAAAGLFLAYVTGPAMGWLHDHYTQKALAPALTAQIVKDGKIDASAVDKLSKDQQKDLDHAHHQAASMTFRIMAIPAAVLIIPFTGMMILDRRRRGRPRADAVLPTSGSSA